MTETRRLRLRCCNPECKRIYELTFELDSQPKLCVQCPYCGKNGTVTLNKYRIIRDNSITRNGGQQDGAGTKAWDFPAVVSVEGEDE
ncbi:MAG: hypothetical protein D3922_16140 [Candidatus Electrothrix sp. AR1]|nr:hypothetical protein [Candidatus Electrothrix sp. AR1]